MGARPSKTKHIGPKPPVSLRLVAQRAGVSTATVSRVINGLDVVSPATVTKVREAMAALSYRPNRTARALITRRNMVLGFSAPSLSSEFYALVVSGAERAARARGYHLLVTSHSAESDIETMNFSADLLDGALVVVTEKVRRDRFLSSFDESVPVVVLGHLDLADASDMPMVVFDNQVGAVQAARHLLDVTPPDRCYFVGGSETNSDTRRRADAFEGVLRKAGHTLRDDQIVFGRYEIAWGRAWARLMHERGLLRGAAVMAGNDDIGVGIYDYALEQGVSIPDELRIVGFDNSTLCGLLRPGLSSVATPREEMGARGAELLINLILGIADSANEVVALPTELVVRGSSAVPGVVLGRAHEHDRDHVGRAGAGGQDAD